MTISIFMVLVFHDFFLRHDVDIFYAKLLCCE